jgi:hypothetical protein
MATPKVKVTYSLSVETLRVLESAAARWGVSKSEAITRAIQAIDEPVSEDRLMRFRQWQTAMGLDAEAAARWAEEARAERKAWPR